MTCFSPLTRIRLPQSQMAPGAQPQVIVLFQSPDEDSLTPKSLRWQRDQLDTIMFQSPDEDSLTPKTKLHREATGHTQTCFSPLTRIRLPQRT